MHWQWPTTYLGYLCAAYGVVLLLISSCWGLAHWRFKCWRRRYQRMRRR